MTACNHSDGSTGHVVESAHVASGMVRRLESTVPKQFIYMGTHTGETFLSISYRVEWATNNTHRLDIYFQKDSHSRDKGLLTTPLPNNERNQAS